MNTNFESFPASISDAVEIQKKLAAAVIQEDQFEPVRLIAGVDAGYDLKNKIIRAAVAVYSYPDLELIETAISQQETNFPYIPGLLSFRELPAILETLDKIKNVPNLVLCDGQGIAHPRGLGIACHLGVLTGLPGIGVAKKRLTGTHVMPGSEKGDWVYLKHQEICIGAVLRTRSHIKPLFISTGHKVSLKTAIGFVLECTTRYRLPEPIRQAHHAASHK